MSRDSSPDLDFLDSFLEHVSETATKKSSSQRLTLDKPVLPSLGPNIRSDSDVSNRTQSGTTIPAAESDNGLRADPVVNWKRASKMVTAFEIERSNDVDSSDSDIESDEETKIRQMAHRATMKRRPTIALALMSSSEDEDSEEEGANAWENRDSYTEALAVTLLDKKRDMLGTGENEKTEDYLTLIHRCSRKISTIKQLQQEFPDMEVENEEENKEKDDQVKGLKKFKKIGTSIKMVTKLSTTFIQTDDEDNPDRQQVGQSKLANRKSRRAAIVSDNTANDSAEIKRNVEKIISEKTHSFVLHPHSSFRFYWDLVSIVILMINIVTIPLELSFYLENTSNQLKTIKFITDIWFILDMMLNFRTGIFTYHIRKVLEMDPTEIRKNYIRSWFFIDLIATFPFDVSINMVFVASDARSDHIIENTKFFKIGRVLKILALLRILRLGRFVRYLHQWEDHLNMNYGFAENMMKSFTWTFILIMVGHWNACILYLIPSQSVKDLADTYGDEYGPAESLDQSWIYLSGIKEYPHEGEMYFHALFKSMSHMLSIGYGCYTPNIIEDMWATVAVLFVGCLVFALFLSQMISFIDQLNMGEKIFKRHLQEVDDYLRFNRTPISLKRSVKDFYEYHYKQRIFDEDQILSELNPLLHEEVVTCGLINYIKDCDFFRTCRDDLQRKLCHLFTTEMYQPYTNIVTTGAIARSFFIIRQGIVAVDSEEGPRRSELYHLGEGDYFGLECFATIINPRSVTTVMSESWVEVIQLDILALNDFMLKSSEYNDELKLIIALANETLKRNGDFARIISKQREAKIYYG